MRHALAWRSASASIRGRSESCKLAFCLGQQETPSPSPRHRLELTSSADKRGNIVSYSGTVPSGTSSKWVDPRSALVSTYSRWIHDVFMHTFFAGHYLRCKHACMHAVMQAGLLACLLACFDSCLHSGGLSCMHERTPQSSYVTAREPRKPRHGAGDCQGCVPKTYDLKDFCSAFLHTCCLSFLHA